MFGVREPATQTLRFEVENHKTLVDIGMVVSRATTHCCYHLNGVRLKTIQTNAQMQARVTDVSFDHV